jgi:hypothetical protein
VKDMADSMNEETSFEAECNTGECGAPDWVIVSITMVLQLL